MVIILTTLYRIVTVRNNICTYIQQPLQYCITGPPTDAKLFGRVSSDAKVSIRDFFPKSTSGGSSLVNVPLSTVTYHCDTMKLTLHTPSLGSYSIIPGVMELTNFALTFELTGDSSISIIFTGEWKLSKTTIHSSLHYLTKTKRFVFSGSPTGSAPSFKSLIEGLVHQSIPIPGDQDTFQDIKILGETDGHSSGIITLSASVGKAGRVYLILEQNPDVTPSRRHAFAVDIEKVRFSKIIQKLTGQDVSSFPFFGSLVIPEVGYTISTKEISSDIIKHLFKASHLLSYNKGVIPEGKVIYVLLGPEIANEPFRMISNNDQIRFEGDNGTHINVAKFIHLIPKANLNLLQLPPGVDNVGQPSITDFILYPLQKRIVVRADLQHTLKYFQNVLSIRNPHIELDVTVPSGALSFEATGDIKLGSTDLSVSIAKDAQHRYIFKARTTNLPLSSILSSFSAKLLPPPLEPISKSLALINFVIKDPRMAMLMESSTSQQIFLTGQPVIAGLSVKRMLATIVRVGGANKIAIGIELEKSNLADILGKISTGASKVIHAIPLLNQARDTVIVVSPEDFNNVALSLDEKHHFDLKRGITVRTNLPFPADESCTRDPFCAVARSLLPHGTVLHIDANIVNVANFRFIASLTGEIAIPGGLKIKKAGVELRVGEDTSIGIIGQIALRNPKLEFTTRIYYSVSGVVLQMIMAGCWRDAFGLGVMDICNVHGSVGIAPGTVISELSLGSEIHFKCLKQKQQQQLTAIGYVGLNTVEPRNNYYYANFPKGLTLASLLGVLCIKVDGVPSPIANTKLQPGFKSSFTVAPLGKSIPEIKLHIPPGLQMNGTVHSLGMEASCNISTTPSERMYVSIALPPLKVGKLLRMFLSRIVQTKGPYLRVDIRPPTVTAEASGYLSVLGITVEATLIFTKQQMSATIQGKILGIVDASLTVYSAHGVSFSSSNFQVRGSFKSKIFSTIENIIKNTAAKAADVAKAALNRAQNYLTSKSSAYRQASNKLSYARRKVTQALNKFKNAERTVNRWKSRVNSACRERSCGSGE